MFQTHNYSGPFVALARDPWTWAASVVAVAYALANSFLPAVDAQLALDVGTWGLLPTGLAAPFASLVTARAVGWRGSALGRAWLLFAIAQASFVCGTLSWTYFRTFAGVSPFPSPADWFYLAFYAIAFVAIAGFAATMPWRTIRFAFPLDAAIFVAGAGALTWALLVEPYLVREGADVGKGAFGVAYACGSGLVVFGIAAVLLRGGIAQRRWQLLLLAVALATLLTADLTWLIYEFAPGFDPGGWPGVLYVASQALQIVAARGEALVTPATTAPGPGAEHAMMRSTGIVPLLAMLGAGSLVLWMRRDLIAPGEGVVLAAMIGAAALAGLRQWLSARELLRHDVRASQQRTERRFAAMFRQSSDVILVVDAKARIQYVTPSAQRALGYEPDDMLRARAESFVHDEEQEAARAFFRQVRREPGATATGEWRLRARDGTIHYYEALATNLLDDPAIGGVVITLRDVTDRRALQDRLSELAFRDSLTRLGNRSRFRDVVTRGLADAAATGEPTAVLFVDLDDFKRINDSLGHHEGDALLRIVADRIQGAVSADAEIARLGGDEFGLLLRRCDADAADAVADALLRALAVPVTLAGAEIAISGSAGDTIAAAGLDADDVLRHADIAMYDAKRRGKGCVARFEPRMQVRARQRLELEEHLRAAIAQARIALHYQPVLDLRTGAMVGVEALARWNHPSHGDIPPGEFVALAEESGQIMALGRLVLVQACTQMGAWLRSRPAFAGLSISVNVSARQLDDDGFVDHVQAVLGDSGVPAHALVLELTESVMLKPRPHLRAMLDRLRRSGVRLALDDFGAGYSSLSYLHHYPFDLLKIDRGLIERVAHGEDGRALVRAVLSVAEALHLAVVAEGIEEPRQRDELVRIGCELGQGFLLAHPMPPADFERWADAFARDSTVP